MIKGIYGINIAVKDLDEAVKNYENIFDVKSEPLGKNDFAFPGLIGARLNINGTYLSLISYTDKKTSVANFIDKNGEGIFLLSVEVNDMDKDVEKFKEKGLNFAIKDTLAGDYGKVNFVHPKSAHGVQLEIYEPKQ